jgi:CHAT domain
VAIKQRQYIDFKLYLTRPPDGKGACQVALLPTPEVGETINPITVPAEKGPSSDLQPLIASKGITLRKLVEFGQGLANLLIPEGTIRERFRYAYDQAGNEGGVRLRLIVADHTLKQWPWEYIYFDPLGEPDSKNSIRGFIALDPRISIVRHEPLPHPHPMAAKISGDLTDVRMLIAAASPKGQPQLKVDKEVGYITNAVQGFNLEGIRIITDPVLLDATPQQLTNALLNKAYVFHFAGHGITILKRDDLNRGIEKEEDYLLLEEDSVTKREARFSAFELSKLLQQGNTRLALLGACYSGKRNDRYPWDGVAGALAAAEIPAIIAMQYEVIDTQAIAFNRAFYTALGLGLSLEEATWSGRVAMLQAIGDDPDAQFNIEWGVPVLYTRLSNGAVFPERMANATASAEAFRKVFSQTVTDVQKGKMTGVEVSMIENGVKIVQKVKTAMG